MAPSDQMSARVSTSLAERICSGAMYSGEPIRAAVLVSDSSSTELPVSAFEMPKSSTFTRREPSARRARNKLPGFRSRCTTPAACASAKASMACKTNSTASRIGKRATRRSSSAMSFPSRNSITM